MPGCPPRAFPASVSSLTFPHSLSLHSTAALALGLLHNPQTPAPSHFTYLETCVPVLGMYGCCKDCLNLISFRLSLISCFILSLKCFSSDSDNCPDVGIRPLLQFPHLPRAGPVLVTLLFFSPSSFIPLSFTWFYIFFSAGQVLLPALSWCSASTSVSEGVFLVYPWRELYSTSTSTYSTTLFLTPLF